MLILKRKLDEEIKIGHNISVKILSVSDGQVKLGITAPDDVQILRAELVEKVKENIHEASKASKLSITELAKMKINKIIK